MLVAEWNTNDCDIKQNAEQHMGQTYQDSSQEEPQNVHSRTYASCLSRLFFHFRAEWP